MKKIKTLILFMASFGLFSCGVDGPAGLGSYVNLTELPTPTIREVSNNYIYWDEVPNASSYVLKINDYQENVGNNLKYSISAMMDSRIESNVETLLHIYVKANGNHTFFSDSKWSNEFTYSYTKESTNSLKELDVPKLESYENNTIRWSNVEHAVGYEILINDTILKTTAYTYYQVTEFENDCEFTFQIRALSAQNSTYSNSNWTIKDTKKFIVEKIEVNKDWKETFVSNGIGQTVNAITDRYIEPYSGAESVFDKNKLYDLQLLENNISLQKANEHYEYSMEDISNSWNGDISAKVYKGLNGNKTNPKNYGKGFCYKFEASANFDLSDENISTELYYTLTQLITAKRVEIAGYNNTEKLTNVLSNQFKEDAILVKDGSKTPEWLINKYGTHVITSGYFGGKIEATYSLISKTDNFNRTIAGSFSVELTKHLTFVTDKGVAVDGGLENKYFENTANVKTHFDVQCIGGESRSFASVESFSENYGSWAKTINNNSTLVDVPDNSLIPVWNLLPSEYDSLKTKMNDYYDEQNENNYSSILNKMQFGNSIQIRTESDFVNKIKNNLSSKFIIMNDIDFNGKALMPFGNFSGSIKGNVTNGKKPTLKNFTLSSTNNQFLGLFSKLEKNGLISNIDIEKCKMTFNYDKKENREGGFGVLAGKSEGAIKNCAVKNSSFNGYVYYNVGTNQSAKLYTGAIVGWNNGGTINDCQSINNTFEGKTNIGRSDGTAECNIGGIAGMCTGQSLVNNSESSGIKIQITLRGGKTWTAINAKFNGRAGGIVGYNGKNASVINCKAKNNDLSNYVFKFEKAESCKYDNNTSKGVFIGKNDGNESSNITK